MSQMERMRTTAPLFISTINLSDTEQRVFQVALNSIKDENLLCEVLPNQNFRGHLVVIDLEAEQSANIFKSLRPGQVKLVISSEHKTGANLVSVLKPIKEDSFKDVLMKVCHKMTAQLNQTDASQETGTSEPQKCRSNIADFMQRVIQLRENKQNGLIRLKNQTDMVIDGEREMLLSRESFESIIAADLDIFEQADIEILADKQNYDNSGYSTMTALSGFLWELAVKTSDSILPAGLASETKISLKAWPNFTRHGYRPEHLKIAALLAKQSISLNVLVEKTALEEDLVQQFINGCYAVGLLNLNSQRERKTDVKQVSQEKKTIFKRLAYKLGFV
jgi:hypothetical protein